MKDRFSKAIEELPEKNAFICESCGHGEVTSRKTVVTEDNESHEKRSREESLHVRGLDVGLTPTEEIIVSDPSPFGA